MDECIVLVLYFLLVVKLFALVKIFILEDNNNGNHSYHLCVPWIKDLPEHLQG